MGSTYGSQENFLLNAVFRVVDEGFTKGYQDAAKTVEGFEKTQDKMADSVIKQTDAISREATKDMKATGAAFEGAEDEIQGLGITARDTATDFDRATDKISQEATTEMRTTAGAFEGAEDDIDDLGETVQDTAKDFDKATDDIAAAATDNLRKASEETKKSGKEIGDSWKNAGDDMTKTGAVMSLAITTPLVALAKTAVEQAAGLAAMESQFSEVFGESEAEAEEAVERISKEIGSLPNRLKPAFVQMAAFAKVGGMETSEALSLAERATRAAADSAAFYDVSLESTTESLRSFLKGNYANDAALGISATETTRNAKANELYGKSFIQLAEDQKQVALLAMVEDGNKLSGALGQAARESEQLENQMGNLKQSGRDALAAIGAPLIEPAVDAMKRLSEMAKGAAEWYGGLDGASQDFAVTLGVMAAAAGPVMTVTGQLISKGGALISNLSEVRDGTKSLTGALGASGTAGLVMALAAVSIAAIKYADDLSSVDKETQAMIDGQKEARKAYQDSTASMEDQQTLTNDLVNELMQLESKTGKTAEEQARMQGIISQLNKSVPDLNLSWDEHRKTLNMSEDALRSVTDAYNAQAKMDAAINEQTRLEEDKLKIQRELETQQAKINEQVEQGYIVWDEQNQQYERTGKNLGYNIFALGGMIETYEALDSQLETTNAELEQQIGITGELIQAEQAAADEKAKLATEEVTRQEQATDAHKKFADETLRIYDQDREAFAKAMSEKILIDKEYREEIEAGQAAHLEFMSGLSIEEIDVREMTAETVSKMLAQQVVNFGQYETDMAEIQGRVSDEYYEHLKSLGSDGAALIKELNEMTDSELQEHAEIWELQMAVANAAAEEEILKGTENLTDAERRRLEEITEIRGELNEQVAVYQQEMLEEQARTDAMRYLAMEEGVDTEKAFAEDLDDLFKATLDNRKAIWNEEQKLAKEELKEVEAANEENLKVRLDYFQKRNAQVDKNMDAMRNFGKLEVNIKEATAEDIRQLNLKQMEAYTNYHDNMAKLSERIPERVLRELQKLGQDGAHIIEEYNNMTDEELAKHVDVWDQKMALAMDVAEDQLGQAPPLVQKSTDELIAKLEEAEPDMASVSKDLWAAYNGAIEEETPKIVSSAKKVSEESKGALKGDYESIADDNMDRYTHGLDLSKDKVGRMAKAVMDAQQKELKRDTDKEGRHNAEIHAEGFKSKKEEVLATYGEVATDAQKKLKRDTNKEGEHNAELHKSGFASKKEEVLAKYGEVATDAQKKLIRNTDNEGVHNADLHRKGFSSKKEEVLAAYDGVAKGAQGKLKRNTSSEGIHNAESHAQGFTSKKEYVLSQYGQVATEAVNKLNQKSTAYSLGASTADAMAAGYKSKKAAVVAAAGEVAQAIPDRTKSVLQMRSPPRVMLDIGYASGDALADSVASKAARVADAAETMTAPLRDLKIDTSGFDLAGLGAGHQAYTDKPTGTVIELHTHIADQDFRAFTNTVSRQESIQMEREALYG